MTRKWMQNEYSHSKLVFKLVFNNTLLMNKAVKEVSRLVF